MRALSVAEVARRVPCDRGEIYKLEDGRRRLNDKWIRKLAKVYEVAPRDLVGGFSLRIDVLCYVLVNARSVEGIISAGRIDYIEAPKSVVNPEHCRGFFIADDSADRLGYPPGSAGVYRRLEHIGRRLRRGEQVVARHFKSTRAAGEAIETVVGLLDIAVNGDIVVVLQTRNRRIGASISVRMSASGERGAVARDGTIDYTPDAEDNAEILGIVESVTIPVTPPAG